MSENDPNHIGKEETTEQANRGEHERDQRAYQQNRIDDKTLRVEKASDLEIARIETAAAVEVERVAKAEELEALAREKHKAHRRIAISQMIVYIMVIGFLGYVFSALGQRDEAICNSADENRLAVRNVVLAIYVLGTTTIPPEQASTPEAKNYLANLETFKREQLILLKDPVCPPE